MKAKEYFEKYEKVIIESIKEDSTTGHKDLLVEMSKEVQTLYDSRKAKSNSALAGIIKELNQKWNAIGTLFEKKYGASPLKRNGFIEFWKHEMPELERIL